MPIPHASLQNKAKAMSRARDTGTLCSDNGNAQARFLNHLIPHNHIHLKGDTTLKSLAKLIMRKSQPSMVLGGI